MTEEQSYRRRWAGTEASPSVAPAWLRFRKLEIPLRPGWRSAVFFVVVGAVAVFLGWEVARAAYISKLSESEDVATLRRAVALDPSNPEIHNRLGMVICNSTAATDPAEGLQHLRRATELNPYTARYWSDLAWVCELSGDTDCAIKSVEHAVRVSPATPQLHWVAGNTLLRTGDKEAAMAEFRRLLELDPTYAPATFHVCLGALRDSQLIVDKVLPSGKDPLLMLAFVNYLSTNEEDDPAHQVWEQVVKAGTPFPLRAGLPYVDHLLDLGWYDEAQGAWRDMEKLGVVSDSSAEPAGNMVFNGDFEQTPLNAGLDWRNREGPYIAIDFSDPAAHTGNRCLRLDFTVSRNEEYAPVYQMVPVEPKYTYVLTAYVRSQDITSDSGPRLQVVDPMHVEQTHGVSETTVGTTVWHQLSLTFCTGPYTKAVQLSVVRPRGRTFPTEITGSFWVDTVVMKPGGTGGEGGCTAPKP